MVLMQLSQINYDTWNGIRLQAVTRPTFFYYFFSSVGRKGGVNQKTKKVWRACFVSNISTYINHELYARYKY